MNKWKREEKLDDAFEGLHKIRPTVEKQKISKKAYKIRLKDKGKEVVLGEVMKYGMTDYATVEYGGTTEIFKNYYKAELRAAEILRS